MDKRILIKKNLYFDSFSLMKISAELKKISGIREAMVCMGTDLNKEFLKNVNLMTPDAEVATVNDLIIAVKGEDEQVVSEGMRKAEELLSQKERIKVGTYRPRTLEVALRKFPEANLVLISIPGNYVKKEAMVALKKGLHVMIFSDNVPIEDEIELKKIGRQEGLLVMGPDCGTAIINGTPLGFANVVRKGPVGIVGASGTGIQELSVILTKAGAGISQAIGTGGRDLSQAVGGIMTKMAIETLVLDSETKVIILLAKAFDRRTVSEISDLLKKLGKPAIVHLIGETPKMIGEMGFETLEDTAFKALAHLTMEIKKDFLPTQNELARIVESETRSLLSSQKYLRGLFSGGSFCAETVAIFGQMVGKIYSNIPLANAKPLPDLGKSVQNTALDLGDDFFTQGRVHPMIDPRIRIERLYKEAEDPETAVVLLDIVLGYGANSDMAGSLLPAITEAKRIFKDRGGYLSVIVNLCGTEDDPQNLREQEGKLKEAGVVVLQTNALASRVAVQILTHRNRG
jgi:succinyl-CoA synthetase alpha subunit